MLRTPARWLKNLLAVRKTAIFVGIIFLLGLAGIFHLHEDYFICKPIDYHKSERKTYIKDSSNISPEVLAELKKNWILEYEEERKLNENEKLVVNGGNEVQVNGVQQPISSQFESIDCIINEDSTVGCLKEKDGDEKIYMPWSFLEKYFEVYGELKHEDGYDRFEFSQSYAKVVYEVGKQYTFDGGFLTFETYNVEIRKRVKCITGIEGVPLSTQWGPQGYFYPIQIAQFGLSHFSKNLTEKPPRKTVYVDGEMIVQGKWKFSNRHCTIENVFDKERKSRVIKFSAPVTLPYNMGVSLTLGNTMEYELAFDIKFVTNGSVSVLLDTGKQFYIHYVTDKKLLEYDKESNIVYGIGSRHEWSHVSRDLLVDLKKGVGLTNSKSVKSVKISIRKVVKLIFHGEGYIDNITISTVDHMTHFKDASLWLLRNQDPKTGGWPIMVERSLSGLPPLAPGWNSAMAQGHGLSTMVRAYKITSNEEYMVALRRALIPYTVPSAEGGVRAVFMDKYVWYEEYPTTPSSFVLNGFIYSLMGLYDFKMLLLWEKQQHAGGRKFTEEDEEALKMASELYGDGMTSLKNMLPLYDGGSRTIYDLRHLALKVQPNVARWDYHTTHMSQLAVLATIDDDPIFMRFFNYWKNYMKGIPASHN